MIRRGSGWGSQPGGVLYPGRGGRNWARPLLLGIILLATLAVAAFVVFSLCSSDSCSQDYCPSNANIATPDGYERLSDIYEWQSDEATAAAPVEVRVELNDSTDDGRNLSFFRYDEAAQAWEPFAPAILEPSGDAVSGRLSSAPPVMTVMRRLSSAGHVVAYLPNNTPLHPDAARLATIVHTRDFTVASDGTLLGTLSDPRALGIVEGSGATHYPTVSMDGADPQAKAIVSAVLSSSATRTAHVQAIVELVVNNNLAGIDIFYNNLAVTERTGFALFIGELAEALHQQKKVLTVTLPPPVLLPDRVDEGAYDWTEIGRAADIVQMGVYRDQNTFRRNIPAILEDLTAKVSPSKLVLSVTPLATEKAPDESLQSMPVFNALSIAAKLAVHVGADQRITTNTNLEVVANNIDRTQNRSGIIWDPQTATVAFTYDLSGGRTVWIENVYSVAFKLEFIPRYGLGGVAVEDASANELLGNIWPAIEPFIASGQPTLVQPNPADLQPRWVVSDGQAEGGQRGVLSWLTPSRPGTYAITLAVSDGVVVLENVIEVNVTEQEAATPAAGGG